MSQTRSLQAVSSACVLLSLAACSGLGNEGDARSLVARGRFEEAVRVAAAEVERNPDSAQAQADHRDATIAYLLEEGRQQTFRDEDDAALVTFARALEVDPTNKLASDWIAKTNGKLASVWRARAFDLHAEDEIDAALAAYERSLRHEPDDEATIEGRAIALSLVAHRSMLGRTYFQDGLLALSDLWLDQAKSRFSYTLKYRPQDGRAKQREDQVKHLIAIERISAARAHEADKRFGAARHEYKTALLHEPTSVDAMEGAERCKVELKVLDLIGRVRMELVRGRFDKAETIAQEARTLTKLQTEEVDGAFASIREARFEKAYNEALALERDWRYSDAVLRYDQLLEKAEYYKDVIARRDALQGYIRDAERMWTRAEAATEASVKLDLYRQIQTFWPEYQDLPQRIAALEAQLAATGG
ncbi:MAG: hypothetical protein RIT40_1809 [Planctomycetota bacterium]